MSNLTLRSVKFDYEKKTNNRALARANAGFLPNSHESFSLMNLHRAERLRRAGTGCRVALALCPVARFGRGQPRCPPKVDSRPAGFSQRWLQEILRRQMRFDGAIFSDDLSMEGARRIDGQVVSYTDAALAALEAGCDLVLLCNQSLGEGKAVDELIDGLAAAQAQGRWQPNVDSESRRLALLPETLPQPWDELMLQPAYMQALDLLP